MPSYIPRLARIVAGERRTRPTAPASAESGIRPADIDRLTRLVPQIRHRLAIGHPLSDTALLASLIAIARHTSHEARWRTAEASTLGRYLATSGRDLRRTLVTLLSLLPKPIP